MDLDDVYAGPTLDDHEDEESDNYLRSGVEGLGWVAPLSGEEPGYRGEVTRRSMASLVKHLAKKRETGVLRVDLRDRMLVFIWLKGLPVYFASDPAEEGLCLEDAISELPRIGRETFDVALSHSKIINRHVALVLADLGELHLTEVGGVMRFMARKLANMLYLRSGGRFFFWSYPVPQLPRPQRLDVEAVLLWDPASVRELPVADG